jgi:PhzF family phenazine biosynthesis protein
MPHVIHQVNAFTAEGKNGNPAGVVLDADGLSDQRMQAIAAGAGFSETAFAARSQAATRRLRFFTPTTEVELCGHATIAAWSLMYQKGLLSAGAYTQQTKAGLLGIVIDDQGLVFMEQAQAQFDEEIPYSFIAPLLGMSEEDFHSTLPLQIVSTGLRDLLVPVKDKAVLARLRPDLKGIADFSRSHKISGFHVFGFRRGGVSIATARNFAPADGIDEEAATGTSNGALLCYLKRYGLLPRQAVYLIEQGEHMGRLSHVYGKFAGDVVWIGGVAKVVL